MGVILSVSDLESDVILRDGLTIRFRPVRGDDAERLLALFGELSERRLYYRFMAVPHIDIEQVRRIVAVDGRTSVTLVAERGGRWCGIAGYCLDPTNRERAEVAF